MSNTQKYEYEVMQSASLKIRNTVRKLTQEPLIEFESSAVKRTSKSLDEIHQEFLDAGFEHTGTALDGKIHYHENENGLNVTLIETRRGSLVLPSGPIRGNLFGENAVDLDINR